MEEEEDSVGIDLVLDCGTCWVADAEYLDPDYKAEGVLAVQFLDDTGLWILIGKVVNSKYSQSWQKCGPEQKPTLSQLQAIK